MKVYLSAFSCVFNALSVWKVQDSIKPLRHWTYHNWNQIIPRHWTYWNWIIPRHLKYPNWNQVILKNLNIPQLKPDKLEALNNWSRISTFSILNVVVWTRGLPQTFASLYYISAPFHFLYVWVWSLIMVADTQTWHIYICKCCHLLMFVCLLHLFKTDTVLAVKLCE